jgi:hypothetical protein
MHMNEVGIEFKTILSMENRIDECTKLQVIHI